MVLPWLTVDYGTIQISLDRLISQQLHSRRAFRRLFFTISMAHKAHRPSFGAVMLRYGDSSCIANSSSTPGTPSTAATPICNTFSGR